MTAPHRAVSAQIPHRQHARPSWPGHPATTPRGRLLLYAAIAVLALLMLWPAAWSGRQMLFHVITMSLVAPFAVGVLRWSCGFTWRTRPVHLWMATLLQMAVFLFWHSPFGMTMAMHGVGGELLQGSLLASACLFWWCLAGLAPDRTWHAIAALLFTGKLFCLVAVLLTFAPRSLYHAMALADQQLAGLLMITLCPLTYVASALWLCWRWLGGLDEHTSVQPGCAPC